MNAVKPRERQIQLGYWKGRNTINGDRWTASEVRSVLINPIYTGSIAYGRTKKENGHVVKADLDLNQMRITEDTHGAIISKDLFLLVNKNLRSRLEQTRAKVQESQAERQQMPPLFGEQFICKCCGRRMTVDYQKYDGKLRFVKYRCSNPKCIYRPYIEERYLKIIVMNQIRIVDLYIIDPLLCTRFKNNK